ncbi:hypothetical protein GCM10012275_40790 [Longimycelium tulufanense]|uniref:Uncharacterized protein n=1 Tax=Longimycelium tulufanense TaxID=907463 RepID=A0A8J3FV90_9PSEU|nr:hypothetical protein [Longimycelium tulufanense]GGM66053.1 hypothetical protein GCM10012275_40790 [Longimycelium tulufanense]
MPAGRPPRPAGPSRSVVVTMWLAAIVATAALVTAAALRAEPAGTASDASVAPSAQGTPVPPNAPMKCGGDPCERLASATVADEEVELLVGTDGRSGRVRIAGRSGANVFETGLPESGVRLTADSLRCADLGRPACLVRGPDVSGVLVGEVYARDDDGAWFRRATIHSDAGYLELGQVDGAEGVRVIALQRSCGDESPSCRRVVAQVVDVNGEDISCTRAFESREQLPGWPNPKLRPDQLEECF